MRDVKRANRPTSRLQIMFGFATMAIGCVTIMTPRPASALILQPINNTLETIVHDTTTTVKDVITPSPKTELSTPQSEPATTSSASVSLPAARTTASRPVVHQDTGKSRATTSSLTARRSVQTHPVIYPAQTMDSNLLQPFSLVKAWPGINENSTGSVMRSAGSTDLSFIVATPAGWSIGGLLWYWWAGLIGAGVYAVRRGERFVPENKNVSAV